MSRGIPLLPVLVIFPFPGAFSIYRNKAGSIRGAAHAKRSMTSGWSGPRAGQDGKSDTEHSKEDIGQIFRVGNQTR